MVLDVLQAAYRVAHDFRPDGAVGLARLMGVNPGTLLNEVNPEQETHKLGIGRAVAMSVVSGDPRILHAFADALGFVALRRPDGPVDASDMALLDLFISRDVAGGSFSSAIASALADGKVSPDELALIRQEAQALMSSVMALRVRLEEMVHE